MNKIEEVATAIALTKGFKFAGFNEATKEAYRKMARAAIAAMEKPLTFDQKSAINHRFQELYEAGAILGKHGFYETIFEAMHTAYAEHRAALSEDPR